MLILVAVTINLATDGGLFDKSRTASKDTEQKKILEELMSMAEFNNDGKIQVDSLVNKVTEKYKGSSYDVATSKLTVKGNKGEFYYKVTETEIKLWEESTGGSSNLETYILGEDKAGRNLFEIYSMDENKFIDDELTQENESSIILTGTGPLSENVEIYIEYNNNNYKFSVDPSTFNTKDLKKIEKPSSEKFGKIVKFANEKWIILYDNGDNIEMISQNTLGNLALGYNDPNIKNNELTNIEKSIYSYNNAITTLNNECEKVVLSLEGIEGIENSLAMSVRSVGSNPNNKNSEATTNITSGEINELYNNKLKSYDNNWQSDFERLVILKALKSNNNYWGASRFIRKSDNNNIFFGVESFYNEWEEGFDSIISIGIGNPDPFNREKGIRPVVKVDSSKLKPGTDTDYIVE